MSDAVNQNDAEQAVYEDEQEKLHKPGRLVQRVGPGISPEIQEFYHGFLFIHEGCIW